MTTENIIQMVREGLIACQPCRAKAVARYIYDHGGENIDLRSVNQILYGALRAEIVQNSNFEWSFKIPHTDDAARATSVRTHTVEPAGFERVDGSSTTQETLVAGERAKILRTLQRLRSGLPPTDGVEHLSVGYSKVVADIQRKLTGNERQGRWIVAKGNYGAGKTHFLATVRSIAHARDYATCYLCADASLNALNHPQRFVSNLLGSLEVPGRPAVGYESLIVDLIQTSDGRRRLLDQCLKWSVGGRMPFPQAISRLLTLESIDATAPGTDMRHVLWTANLLAEELCGSTISYRGATPDVRQTTYHLLLLARDLVIASGHRGIVLLIDETESIYTKLPNCRSRIGAIKVLAAFCESESFDNIITALTITPDAHASLLQEIKGIPLDDCLERLEPVEKLRQNYTEDSPYLIDCRPIHGSDIPKLLEKLRLFYLSAYKYWLPTVVQAEDWEGFISRNRTLNLPNRLLVRHAVDMLDSQRYAAK